MALAPSSKIKGTPTSVKTRQRGCARQASTAIPTTTDPKDHITRRTTSTLPSPRGNPLPRRMTYRGQEPTSTTRRRRRPSSRAFALYLRRPSLRILQQPRDQRAYKDWWTPQRASSTACRPSPRRDSLNMINPCTGNCPNCQHRSP